MARRGVLRLARALGLLVVFVVAAALALVLHADSAAERRLLARAVPALLGANLKGSFTLDSIERIRPSEVVFRGFRAIDPRGRQVLEVERVRVEADLAELAFALLLGPTRLSIVLERVQISRAKVALYDDAGDGVPSIADTFWPSSPPTGQGRPVRLAVRVIEIDRAEGSGKLAGLPALRATIAQANGWLRVSEAGVDLSFQRFATTIDGLPKARVAGVTSLRLREPGWLRVSFDGSYGALALTARLRQDDEQLGLTLDVPRALPDEVRALLPAYPLVDEVALHAELAGTTPYFALSTRLQVGRGVVLGSGTVDSSGAGRAELAIDAERVNVRSLLPGAPPTELDLVLALELTFAPEGPTLSVDTAIEPAVLGELALPPLLLTGRYQAGRFDGRALLEEPGMPMLVDLDVGSDGVADLTARVRGLELAAVPRLRRTLELAGRADLELRAHVEEGRVAAEVELALARFRYQSVGAGRAALRGTARGSLAAPEALELDLSLAADTVRIAELELARLTARVTGPVGAPLVRAAANDARGGSIAAEGVVAVRDEGVRLDSPRLEAQREGLRASGRAARISVAGPRLELRELALEVSGAAASGAPVSGRLGGTLVLDRDLLELDARAESLELAALRTLFGLGAAEVDGKLSFEGELVVAEDLRRGRIAARLDGGRLGPAAGLSASVDAALEGSALVLDSAAQLENLGEVRARLQASLAHSPLEARAYRELTGRAVLDVVRVELGALSALGKPLGVPPLRGSAGLELALERGAPDELPSATLLGFTQSFGIDVPRDDEPLRLDGIDLHFGTSVLGGSGETEANLRLVDSEQTLATLSLRTTVDVARLLSGPDGAVQQLAALPITGKLRMDDRKLDSLPDVLRPRGVSGRAKLEANLAGTLGGPEVFARASVEALELTGVQSGRPLDVCASLGFSSAERRLAGSGEVFAYRDAGVCSGRRLVRYAVDGKLVPEPGSPLGRLEGTLVAELERLPLETLPGVGDQGLSGLASGTLSLARTQGPPVVFARFELENTRVQEVPIGGGTLDVRSNDRAIAATLRLSRAASLLEATGLALLDTQSALPVIDFGEPIGARLRASELDAVVLLPFARSLFTELGGRLDAQLDVLVGPGPDGSNTPSTRVSGSAALRDGNLQLAGLGLRLNDVQLRARAEPVGPETQITVESLQARAGRRGERLQVRSGRLWLHGAELARAEGIIDATELPLLLEGVSQATATTRQGIAFTIARKPERMEATFDVPYLNVTLPQSSARGVISLAENRSIEVLQPLGEPQGPTGDGLPWLLGFRLGRDVKLTRSDLDLPLSGNAQVLLADETEITGDLELAPGGRIQVSGKTFVIESGEVHFDTGEATNPRLRVTANWRAPDGTIVIANVSGTFEQARLRLSSDPARSEQDIYALLLGGTGSGGEGGDPAATGAGVGADLLGSLLVNTPLSEIEFRAGSEQLTDQRIYSTYTAAMPISDEVWFEGSYKTLNTNDPTQERDALSGTLDWRFRRNWSLRTEIGTIGTGLDLVWQYRY